MRPPDALGRNAAWPQNAIVTVYAGDGFGSAEDIRCLTEVLNNYNESADAQIDGNNSGVHFVFTYGTTDMDANSVGDIVNGKAYVMRVNHRTPVHGLFGEAGGESATVGGVAMRYNAVINIAPQTSDCEAFKQSVAHEIGHTFGLDECRSCTIQKQSMMVGATGYNDTASGVTFPRSCDVSVWNAVGQYQAIDRCNPAHRNDCLNDGRNRWDFFGCSCCFQCIPGGTPPPGSENNCWTASINFEFRQGFCTYYGRHLQHYCGGVLVETFDVIDSVDCQEIG